MKKIFIIFILVGMSFSFTSCNFDTNIDSSTTFNNTTNLPISLETKTISEAKNNPGSKYKLCGILTTIDGSNFIIEDSSGAIYVRYTINSFKIGDEIALTGLVNGDANGSYINNISEIEVLSSNNELPQTVKITNVNFSTLKSFSYQRVSLNLVSFDNITVTGKLMSAYFTFNNIQFLVKLKGSNVENEEIYNALNLTISNTKIDLIEAYITCENNKYLLNIQNINQLNIHSYENPLGSLFIANDITTYNELSNNKEDYNYMPSVGDVNILVVPIDFEDGVDITSQHISDLKNSFFGNNYSTGWESLTSYYYKSSYGKLNINGTITDPVQLKDSKNYMTTFDDGEKSIDIEDKVLPAVMDDIELLYDLTNYDYDNDEIIDGIYFVYNVDVYNKDSSQEIQYENNGYYNDRDSFWAYTSWYIGPNKYDEMDIYQFVWIGLDFFYYGPCLEKLSDEGDNLLNTETIIHETGHMMGADDYYDYSNGQAGSNLGIGEDDMMDSNYGDHNAVTKILYGWINPTIITSGTHEIELDSFAKNGDCVIISPYWNDETNILSEFFIIDYYNYDGLDGPSYLRDSRTTRINGCDVIEGFISNGIRIYYVNANADKANMGTQYYTGTYFTYDNSDSPYAFITLVNKFSSLYGTSDFTTADKKASESSLFDEGEIFTPNTSSIGYCSKYWNFSVEVISLGETANIKIIMN